MARALSLEDKDLSNIAINVSRNKVYRDIDLTFAKKGNGDVFKKSDAAAVKQAVKNLVLTNFYEKPFLPRFGGNIRGLLFELADDDTEFEIENAVITSIERYEPRAEILSVTARSQPDLNALDVTIIFKVINTGEEVVFTTTLTRLR